MILKNKKEKIKINLLTNFKDRVKSFRFKLTPINEGICYYKKRNINTYLFCQKTNIIFTDINNKVLKISSNTCSEKIIFGKKGTFFIYILNENSLNDIKIGDILNISYTDLEKEILDNYNKEKKK